MVVVAGLLAVAFEDAPLTSSVLISSAITSQSTAPGAHGQLGVVVVLPVASRGGRPAVAKSSLRVPMAAIHARLEKAMTTNAAMGLHAL